MADVDERTPEFFMPCLRQGAAGLLPLHLQPNPCNMEVRIQLERSGLAFLRLASDRLADRRQDFGGEMAVEEPPVTMVDAFEELPTGLSELSVRRQSLQKLERVLVQQVDSLATDIIDAVMDALLKPLLKRLKDPCPTSSPAWWLAWARRTRTGEPGLDASAQGSLRSLQDWLGHVVLRQAPAKPFSPTSSVSLTGGAQQEAGIQLQQRTATLVQTL
ncbi:unnamed protein product [Effrenium voratum]|nr:unnamed protein product [Effrenium voratum]